MPGKRAAPRKKRGCLFPILLISGFLFWVPVELYLSNNVLRTEQVTVASPRLPAAFDGFRVLHLSDLHEKTFGADNADLIRAARAAAPDLIAVTGDLIQSREGLRLADRILRELAAIAPVYYVTGNHEWAADWNAPRTGGERLTPDLRETMRDAGAVWLDSSFETLGRDGGTMLIAGLCDPNGPAAAMTLGELRAEIDAARPDDPFTLLLAHRHDRAEEYAGAGFDIVLTGHAHGGVIRPPFTDGLIGPDRDWFPRGTSGVVTEGGTSVVVSRGLGDTYVPRFLNRPQVLVVTLRRT
ncbi:MAG: metallophosphoesterase [Oscillospiraceae bacterium]|jgi:predicted MPP superfamily phosphohydrolase|nr:metallophosphoesterase [Oscillospiraceae bacterium]